MNELPKSLLERAARQLSTSTDNILAHQVAESLRAVADAWPTQPVVTSTPERSRERRAALALAQSVLAQNQPTLPQVRATRYEVSLLPENHPNRKHYTLFVEHRGQDQWTVVWPGTGYLSDNGEWDPEPLTSNRSDEWLAHHRFDLTDALSRAQEVAPTLVVNGRSSEDELLRSVTHRT